MGTGSLFVSLVFSLSAKAADVLTILSTTANNLPVFGGWRRLISDPGWRHAKHTFGNFVARLAPLAHLDTEWDHAGTHFISYCSVV